MIKKIHYCWFGGNPLTEIANKCISSWKEHMPEYEIVEWNESNYDVTAIPYIKQAYEQKKYAFVSDYARFDILNRYGGVYLDIDVEILKSVEPLLDKGVLGFESHLCINPGLIMYSTPDNMLYDEILGYYKGNDFNINYNVVNITTDILIKYGLKLDNTLQEIKNIKIYPMEYFNPRGEFYYKPTITPNTYSIHHYNASWTSYTTKERFAFKGKYGKNWKIMFFLRHPILTIKHIFSKRG